MISDVRTASGRAFNAPYRLEIAAAVYRLGKDQFTTGEVIALLDHDVPSNVVSRNLKKLAEDPHLLRKVEGLWHRRETVYWEFCERWYRELLDLGSARRGRKSV